MTSSRAILCTKGPLSSAFCEFWPCRSWTEFRHFWCRAVCIASRTTLLRGSESNRRLEVMLTATTFVALAHLICGLDYAFTHEGCLPSSLYTFRSPYRERLGSALPCAQEREGFTEFGRWSCAQLLAQTPELFKPPEVPLLYPAIDKYTQGTLLSNNPLWNHVSKNTMDE